MKTSRRQVVDSPQHTVKTLTQAEAKGKTSDMYTFSPSLLDETRRRQEEEDETVQDTTLASASIVHKVG